MRIEGMNAIGGIDQSEKYRYRPKSGSAKAQGGISFQDKMQQAKAYEEELEDAKINDPQKYMDMMLSKQQAAAKTLAQLERLAVQTGGDVTYKDVNIKFDFINRKMTIGDMERGEVIHMGVMSNGYSLSVNRENIDQLVTILDLFTPEDINKILEAITHANMKNDMEKEVEDALAEGVKTASTEANGDTKVSEASVGTKVQEEEAVTQSQIVTNPDGSRKMVVTVKINGQEYTTQIELSPERDFQKTDRVSSQMQKAEDAYEKQVVIGDAIV